MNLNPFALVVRQPASSTQELAPEGEPVLPAAFDRTRVVVAEVVGDGSRSWICRNLGTHLLDRDGSRCMDCGWSR